MSIILDKKLLIVSIINLFIAYKLYFYIMPKEKEITTIPIAIKIDNEHFYESIITLTSLIENISPDTIYDINILVPNNFMINNRLKLLTLEVKYKNIKIFLIESEEPFVKIKNFRSFYYKIFLPYLIPNFDKVIFLHWNTLIFAGLEQLYNMDLKDNFFLGFLNNENNIYNNLNDLNIKIEKSIKTNILLVNMKKLKENNYHKEFKNLYLKYKDNKEINEEILINIVYKDKIGILPAKYGMPNFNSTDLALEYNNKINEIYRYDKNEFISAYYKPIVMNFICEPLKYGNKCYNYEAYWFYTKKSEYYDEMKSIYGKIMEEK